MEDIIENFAERIGIPANAAKKGISITSRYFIQNQIQSKQQVFYQCYHQV